MQEETLFHLALAKPAGERDAFLTEACARPLALRRRLQVLLEAYETPSSCLARPALDAASTGDAQPGQATDMGGPGQPEGAAGRAIECPGSCIGPYRLVEQIGEG